MIIHLVLFICYLLCITYLYGANFFGESVDDVLQDCRFLRTFEVGWYLTTLTNFFIACLFTYLSIELSQPLNDYWLRSLMVFKENRD